MSHEMKVGEMAKEYSDLKSALSGFVHNQALDDEFKRLAELENKLFAEEKILEQPELLLHMNVIVRQGEDGAESTGYFQGKVQGVEKDSNGKLKSIILKDSSLKLIKLIPYGPGITYIAPLG